MLLRQARTSRNGTTFNEEIPTALFSMQSSTKEYSFFLVLYIVHNFSSYFWCLYILNYYIYLYFKFVSILETPYIFVKQAFEIKLLRFLVQGCSICACHIEMGSCINGHNLVVRTFQRKFLSLVEQKCTEFRREIV